MDGPEGGLLMTVSIASSAVMLTIAALLVIVRMTRGPSVLDRVVASDVMVSIVVCVLGTEAAVTRHTTTLPILISLSLVGFVGAVSVARFVSRDHDEPHAGQLDVVSDHGLVADPPEGDHLDVVDDLGLIGATDSDTGGDTDRDTGRGTDGDTRDGTDGDDTEGGTR